MPKHLVIADSVIILTKDLLSWTKGEKIEVLNYFNLLTTKTHLESLILIYIDTSTFI